MGTFVSYESGYQFVDNFTYTRGNHAIKFGVELLPNSFLERTRNLNGTFTFTGLAANSTRGTVSALQQAVNAQNGTVDPSTGRPYTYTQYTRATGQEFTTSRIVSQGYFAQDDWRVTPRVKLTYGPALRTLSPSARCTEPRLPGYRARFRRTTTISLHASLLRSIRLATVRL